MIASYLQTCTHCPQPTQTAVSMHRRDERSSLPMAGQPSLMQAPHLVQASSSTAYGSPLSFTRSAHGALNTMTESSLDAVSSASAARHCGKIVGVDDLDAVDAERLDQPDQVDLV